jgi:hypothetical protein
MHECIFMGSREYSLKGRQSKFTHLKSSPLFAKSTNTVEDLCRTIVGIRQRFGSHIGDQIQSCILGMMASFLPKDNILQKTFSVNPSMYQLNEFIKDITLTENNLSSITIDVCINGCWSYVGGRLADLVCPKCKEAKLVSCTRYCYSPTGEMLCSHSLNGPSKRTIYYNSIRSRLLTLLNSDMKNFFHYPELRPPSARGSVYRDVFDGSSWKWFEENKPRGTTLIGIQMSWDGAQVFDTNRHSMWPIFWSILNFPPEFRDKPFIGMHMASIDTCTQASLQILVDELKLLWEEGFYMNGRRYVVALISIICDGRGREKIRKVQGAGSHAGCHLCDFRGTSFAKRVVFRNWQR